MQDDHNCSV